ncbi:S9 family peptidase [Carboxylicivirga linearis]|uniref:S9 family peptidase n=1 Tax=Carboxylicivirga linearis TaxID=1628157 RepID=A0ABS5K083_9BACT|nr:prolyl oligopeptidase family serine peptidase [Carboxylicivirga linearis]MBS2100575.1 S9 family peptidase [Carboxylicivirga linearis]
MSKKINKSIGVTVLSFLITFSVWAEGKKTLDYTVYDSWKSIDRGYVISNDGDYISYVISPQEGDSYLYIYNRTTGALDSISRGKTPRFSFSNSFLAFKVVPQADTVRALKLDKAKKDKFPKDSLFIQSFSSNKITKVANLKSWSVPRDGGDWLAYMLEKEIEKQEEAKDTAQVQTETAEVTEEISTTEEGQQKEEKEEKKDKKDKKKSFKSKGKPLVFFRPSTGDSLYIEKVSHYDLADDGSGAYIVQSVGDTTEVSKVLRFNPVSFTVDTIFKQIGKINKISSDYKASQCAFLFTDDTTKVKVDRLYHFKNKMKEPIMVMDTLHASLPAEWSVLSKGSLNFSRDGSKLYFGAGKRPQEEPKDTLTADEKVHVDIWNWQDKEIQPMQKKNVKRDKDPAYKCVYHIKSGKIVPLESSKYRSVRVPDKGNLNIGFSAVDTPYKRAQSWSAKWSNDYYKVDLITGKKELLQKDVSGRTALSESGKWVVFYQAADSAYFSINVATGNKTNISKGAGVMWVNELHDTPSDAGAYGIVEFTSDGKSIVVYDRYDIWQLDLSGKKSPVCLTNGEGRKNNTRFRYIKLDSEEDYIDLNTEWLLKAFNDVNKQSGYYKLKKGILQKAIEGDYNIYNPVKAKNADVYVWRKSTFKQYPELLLSDDSFKGEKTISNTNPQQKDYRWGDIQLVEWVASDGLTHQGLLVTPENMDKDKKYPMISYFYERLSDRLHSYYRPAPSRSTVNWSFYASNGYVLFIPDIYYRDGDPGLCAYEAVVSGCLAMADRFDFIDREHMGIQGQSWGGYQVAHLVTRTNLFKAAMAGAPVSNMTSAYGGIRWGSGMSRMFQYEHTQSRIGGTLWEKTNKYIENSPVFFAPQVETPLLIMHNDNDGAVPWYQGIEYFMALRRLDKPAWMLVYNNEEHNLTRRANEKDLSRRMMQFFDHYLKDEPVPVWMHNGIPAVKKGDDLGYDLVE